MTPPAFARALELLDAGDAAGLAAHLAAHPGLARLRVKYDGEAYFGDPALLDYVAENPIRHGTLPANIVAVARVILDAGARDDAAGLSTALGLVASGRVARESGVQIPLIDLLCDTGADPNSAVLPALLHGECEAANALLRHGATPTLPVVAALGRVAEFRRLLPAANAGDRRAALALAAQYGRAEILAWLLDAGEDPNRYNPEGFYPHSTPLHQAAGAGHEDTVRLLVERGARFDIADKVYGGTALDWANHAARPDVAAFLSSSAAGRSRSFRARS